MTGPPGAFVIYPKVPSPSTFHAAMSLGNGKITQHNGPKFNEDGVHNKDGTIRERMIYVKKEKN